MRRGGWLAVAGLMLVAGCEGAMPDSGQAYVPPTGRGTVVPANLRALMNEMNSLQFYIKQDAKDPAKQEVVLQNIAIFERDAAAAKLMPPGSIGQLPAGERGDAASDFRIMFTGIYKDLLDMEDALIAGKMDEFNKAAKDIEVIESAGHMEFLNH